MPPQDLDSARENEEKEGLDVRKVFGVDVGDRRRCEA
jgi:hypothetical protein